MFNKYMLYVFVAYVFFGNTGRGGKVILNNLVDHSQVLVVPLPDAPVGEMQFV